MGQVSSTQTSQNLALFLPDQQKFSLTLFQSIDEHNEPILTIIPDNYPSSYLLAQREDSRGLVEYVQDSTTNGLPNMLLKIDKGRDLLLRFRFAIHKPEKGNSDTTLSSLTFIHAANEKELNNILNHDLNSNPTYQNFENTFGLGDYSTNGKPVREFEWSWNWVPTYPLNEKLGGWKSCCCFAEYDKELNKFNILAKFQFWVEENYTTKTWGLKRLSTNPEDLKIKSLLHGPLNNLNDILSPDTPSVTSDHSLLSPTTDNDLSSKLLLEKSKSESSEEIIDEEKSKQTQPNLIKNTKKEPALVCSPRPEDLSQPDDGPVFRSRITALEKKTGGLKAKIKKLLKSVSAFYELKRSTNEAHLLFIDTLKEVAMTEAPNFQATTDVYFDKIGRHILQYEMESTNDINNFIIEPLRSLYEIDIKSADSQKREFDEESKEYYAWLSRYLSIKQENDKKKAELESKYQEKRKTFELHRFDYYSYMQDLHGGRKENEVIYQLCLYGKYQLDRFGKLYDFISSLKPKFDGMMGKATQTNKEWSAQRYEREEQRRALQKSNTFVSSSDTGLNERLASQSNTSSNFKHNNSTAGNNNRQGEPTVILQNSSNSAVPSASTKFKGIRDLEENDLSKSDKKECKKEGLLWAMSRPGTIGEGINLNKAGWHKFWVVLSGGYLSEYTNWKQAPDLHNEPIDLRMASVREARNSDRRFCFEVITPQYKRVYQATSEEDMNSWINIISNAIASILDGSGTMKSVDSNNIKKESGSLGLHQVFSKSGSVHRRIAAGRDTIKNSIVNGRLTLNNDENKPNKEHQRIINTNTNTNINTNIPKTKLLDVIHNIDASNKECADCGCNITEWISINLFAVLCIDCGGIHRSLGTHISKVRSLTLDTVSFTPDLIDALRLLSNKKINSIWEEKLNIPKPNVSTNRETKQTYITQKYVTKSFLEKFSDPTAVLISAMYEQNATKIIHALACGADPNIVFAVEGPNNAKEDISILLYSLINSDPNSTTFPFAEILMKNGANFPEKIPSSLNLSENAQKYLKLRKPIENQYSSLSLSSDNSNKTTSTFYSNDLSTASNKDSLSSNLQRRISHNIGR